MLGEKDLIYFGACLLLSGESSKNGLNTLTETDINSSVEIVEEVFEKVFNTKGDSNKMIVE